VVDNEISLHISIDNFKSFFQLKQECTTSSPSGRHMGHYRTLLDCICNDNTLIPNLIIDITYPSLSTASPLTRWQTASQIMLEKGKRHYIENLRIIQLCKADLNFVLHVIWGHHLICHANHHKVLDDAQFAIPGQTFNNAVLNNVLFFELSRQSLSPGILSEFDATATFDWVLAGLSIITCQCIGLP